MKKKRPAAQKPVKRQRKKVNLTLSDEAREIGERLARENGITFSRLVEILVRGRLKQAGLAVPDEFGD